MQVPDVPTSAEVHALFERVMDLDAHEREAVLQEACSNRPGLRARVEALLAADADPHELLDTGPFRQWQLLMDDDEQPPERIGSYRIVRELGRGGMGVVYLADRDDADFSHKVALKVIAPRHDAREVAERFRRERQILANLKHPNIAQLHDGGLTPDGLPFIAMEYVEGVRIDHWCDERRLGVEDRLRLFLTVCDAVHYAQQNLVVHRDLKPANVLVTEDGHVKLLDFGIARLLPESGVSDPSETALHAYTPRYASPEQIRRSGESTATDVYALGVILYELLAGVLPFPEVSDPFEAARVVLESDPPPPSQAVERVSDDVAMLRGLTRDRLRRALRGDLDAILLKALRRDAADRYSNAGALRDDLLRHLRNEPVLARPDSARYRMRKFVRRHRGAVAAVAALLLVSAGFTALYTTRITRERDRAELNASKAQETRDFLIGLFNANLPHESFGEEFTVSDMLERGIARADSLVDQPELRALLLVTLGDVYRVLGRYAEATALIDSSVAAYRALESPDDVGLADALASQGLVRYDVGDYAAALPPTREAHEIYRRVYGEEDSRVLTTLGSLATLLSHTGDLEESLRAQEELLVRRRRVLGPDDPTVAVTLNNIGSIHYREERYEDAHRHFSEALELRRRLIPREHPDFALSLNNLAATMRAMGDLAGAESLFRESLELRREVLGETHPRVAVSHYQLGRILQARGEYGEAERHLRAALEIDRQAYGPDHPEVGVDALTLARLLVEKGDCVAALVAFDEAIRVFEVAGRGERAEEARGEREGCGAEA